MIRRVIRRYQRIGGPLRLYTGGGGEENPPFRLKNGMEARVGEAVVTYRDEVVRACDNYGCAEAYAGDDAVVEVKPVPAVHRLKKFSPFIYIEFEKRLYIRSGEARWVLVPIDLEVYIGTSLLTVLSPARVKYTLLGDVLGGTVCRYARSQVYRIPPQGLRVGYAILGFRLKSKEDALLPGIGFNALKSSIYRDQRGQLYYSLVAVEVEGDRLTARVQDKPPAPGLQQVYRPKHVALSVMQQLQPFTMQF